MDDTSNLAVLAEMLRDQGVWAEGHVVKTCGPTTGHIVRTIALCENAFVAQIIADLFKQTPA